ncbi:MAG: phasin family protein [Pseudomonadota bacterium]|nr:phasin family protein [Pseudomonadota bacterium]
MIKKPGPTTDEGKSTGAGLFDSALAGSVKESAQQIWLAGMGAFAKAQAEGRQVFESLVKEGTSLQQKTQSVAEEKLGEAAGRMSSLAEDVGTKAGQQWDRLESIFEDRTAKALKKLGVPSAKDVQALMDRIDALSAQVARGAMAAASGAAKPTAKSAAKRTSATRAKPAPKRASAKTASRAKA